MRSLCTSRISFLTSLMSSRGLSWCGRGLQTALNCYFFLKMEDERRCTSANTSRQRRRTLSGQKSSRLLQPRSAYTQPNLRTAVREGVESTTTDRSTSIILCIMPRPPLPSVPYHEVDDHALREKPPSPVDMKPVFTNSDTYLISFCQFWKERWMQLPISSMTACMAVGSHTTSTFCVPRQSILFLRASTCSLQRCSSSLAWNPISTFSTFSLPSHWLFSASSALTVAICSPTRSQFSFMDSLQQRMDLPTSFSKSEKKRSTIVSILVLASWMRFRTASCSFARSAFCQETSSQQLASSFTVAWKKEWTSLVALTMLFELTVGLLSAVLLSVDGDAGGTEGQQALGVLAEVGDELLGVEGAALRLVDLLHRNRKSLILQAQTGASILTQGRRWRMAMDGWLHG